MKARSIALAGLIGLSLLVGTAVKAASPEIVDKSSNRVRKALTHDGRPIRNWYFTDTPFYSGAAGKNLMLFVEKKGRSGEHLYSYDLDTDLVTRISPSGEPKKFIPDINQRTGEIVYQSGDTLFALDLKSSATRELYKFPYGVRGAVTSINADGSLLAGRVVPPEEMAIYKSAPKKQLFFDKVYDLHAENKIFVIDLKTRTFRTVLSEPHWINHVQFSPIDPSLLMYAREGPWHLVDRIWALDVRTGQKTLVQPRTQQMEIAGHEFFQENSTAIWYDHQSPKSQNFFLACFNTAQRRSGVQYPLSRETWSLHFTMSPTGRFFVGDGGFAGHAARTNAAKYLNAYIPKGDRLEVVRLLNMDQHDYMKVEPNVHVSLDERSVVFSGHFDGETQLYKIDISDLKEQLSGADAGQASACASAAKSISGRATAP